MLSFYGCGCGSGGSGGGGLQPGDDPGPVTSNFVVDRILTSAVSYEQDKEHSVLVDDNGHVLIKGF